MTGEPLELALFETGPPIALRLSSTQVATLAGRGDVATLTPGSAGMWLLRGNRKVGGVVLGTGADAIRLRIRPKLPIERVLFLAGFAAQSDIWDDAPLNSARHTDLETVVAGLFARTAGRALDRGVLQGYSALAEQGTVIRGRIDTTSQIRRHGLPIPIAVTYDDFTTDIAENQILLAAARRCASFPGLDRQTSGLLHHLAHRLNGVRSLRSGEARPSWHPSSLNAHCQPALRLAELILDATTPDPIHAGPTIADGFLIDMAVVFEAFLTRTFEAALHRHGHRSAAQQTRHRLDEARRITLKPDITVYRRGRVASVIDAKYKTLTAGRPSNEDLYQLTAYCTALGVEHGHLVYAAGTPAATRHEIRQTAITVTAHALDLTAPASELIACIDRIALAIAEPATATAARFGDLAPRPG